MPSIKHSGIIVNITQNIVSTEIVSHSACASCQSKSVCQLSESKDKRIDTRVFNPENYAIGQSVNVVMQEQQGLKAVFWAYVMPFFVCIIALFGLSMISDNELIYGGGAILTATLYFFGLKLVSKRLAKKFVWYLESN